MDTLRVREMEEWTWAAVWRRRLARHRLLEPAPRERLLEVIGQVCGIHAQMAPSAELSLGLRVEGITRQDVRAALADDRTLVKTYGLRGTLHLFPSHELGLWLAALRAKAPPREVTPNDPRTLTPQRRDQVLRAIDEALAERTVLTREELEVEVEHRVGNWATEPAFEAFGGHLPRWQLGLHRAARDGAIVFGPNRGNRVTYVRTADWLGALPEVSGDVALREVCWRFLDAYGPATHVEFARWFATSPKAARELMRSLSLDEVDVEGWRAWLPRGGSAPRLAGGGAPRAGMGAGQTADQSREAHGGHGPQPTPSGEASELDNTTARRTGDDAVREDAGQSPNLEHEERPAVHLLPHFDCYVVGGFPRSQLIPETAPAALRKGTAAPFSVLLVEGVVAGLWERRARGKQLEVRVHAFDGLSATQQREVERQAVRIGEIQQLRAVVSFGHVVPRGHL
jgi:hypothetical protein